MPVRSLTSSVHTWPTAETVRSAVAEWGNALIDTRPRVQRVGVFGSYARGDWGVGSDLDVVVLVDETDVPFLERPSAFDTLSLPVPVDLLVYTLEEWRRLGAEPRGPAADTLVWVARR